MPVNNRVTIVNVGYRSTNFWVVSAGRRRLLIDLGWPGMLGPLLHNLKRMDIPLDEILYGLATHYHIDHAGCAQELKQRGMRLIVTPEQLDAIHLMKTWIKPADKFVEISVHDNLVLPTSESRSFLSSFGLDGEIVHTPGHSADSVSLVLDNGAAFVGDLAMTFMNADDDRESAQSWQTLRDLGVTTIYGGHGPVRPL